jgi:hypothetical protein
MTTKKKQPIRRYRCATGIDAAPAGAKPAQRFEPGQFIDAEYVRAAPWLVEQGLVVEEVEEQN